MRIKLCRDPEEDQEEAAEAADLAVALAAEAEASAADSVAVAADLAEDLITIITDRVFMADGFLDLAVTITVEAAALADCLA